MPTLYSLLHFQISWFDTLARFKSLEGKALCFMLQWPIGLYGGRLLHGDDLEPQAVILSLQEAWFSWKINASMWSVLLHGIIGVAPE